MIRTATVPVPNATIATSIHTPGWIPARRAGPKGKRGDRATATTQAPVPPATATIVALTRGTAAR